MSTNFSYCGLNVSRAIDIRLCKRHISLIAWTFKNYESGRIGDFFMLRAYCWNLYRQMNAYVKQCILHIRRISHNTYLYERIPLEYEVFFQFSHISFSSERDDTFLALKISMSSQQGAPYNMTFACVRIYTSGILSILHLCHQHYRGRRHLLIVQSWGRHC